MTKIKYLLGGNGESISLLKADGNMQIYGGTLSSNSYYLPISEDGGSTRVTFEINDESVDTSKIELAIAPSTWTMEQIAEKETWKYPFTFYSTSFATLSEPIKECSLYIRDKNGFMLQKIPVYFIYSLNPNAIYANEFNVETIKGQGTFLNFKFSPLENRKIKKVKLYAFNYEKDSTDYPTWEDSNKITGVNATDKTGSWTQNADFTYEDDNKTISFTTPLDMSSEVTISLKVRGLSETNIYARAKFIDEDGIEYDWQEFIN